MILISSSCKEAQLFLVLKVNQSPSASGTIVRALSTAQLKSYCIRTMRNECGGQMRSANSSIF